MSDAIQEHQKDQKRSSGDVVHLVPDDRFLSVKLVDTFCGRNRFRNAAPHALFGFLIIAFTLTDDFFLGLLFPVVLCLCSRVYERFRAYFFLKHLYRCGVYTDLETANIQFRDAGAILLLRITWYYRLGAYCGVLVGSLLAALLSNYTFVFIIFIFYIAQPLHKYLPSRKSIGRSDAVLLWAIISEPFAGEYLRHLAVTPLIYTGFAIVSGFVEIPPYLVTPLGDFDPAEGVFNSLPTIVCLCTLYVLYRQFKKNSDWRKDLTRRAVEQLGISGFPPD